VRGEPPIIRCRQLEWGGGKEGGCDKLNMTSGRSRKRESCSRIFECRKQTKWVQVETMGKRDQHETMDCAFFCKKQNHVLPNNLHPSMARRKWIMGGDGEKLKESVKKNTALNTTGQKRRGKKKGLKNGGP